MKCPGCSGKDTRVIDSRPSRDGTKVRRRRQCPLCGARFTTYECLDESPIIVVKKDGRREEFNRGKVLDGFVKACEKRPVSLSRLEEMVDELAGELRGKRQKEVTVGEIGELALAKLLEVDTIAYVRFVSVYRNFDEPEDFLREVEHLFDKTERSRSVTVEVKRVRKTDLPLPAYARDGDAGVDLMNAGERVVLQPGERVLVPTGLAVAVPRGFELQVRPRSGLALKKGITVVNSPGTVDSGYRGEIGVVLLNTDAENPVVIEHGERIAQAVLARCEVISWREVDALPASSRGEGGFGSTEEGRGEAGPGTVPGEPASAADE